MVGLVGCTSTTDGTNDAPQTATPSPVMLAISGGIDVMLPDKGAGAELNAPCTPPSNARTQLGLEVRVTDGEGTVLGTGKIEVPWAAHTEMPYPHGRSSTSTRVSTTPKWLALRPTFGGNCTRSPARRDPVVAEARERCSEGGREESGLVPRRSAWW
ncbi:hypothetical protein ACIBG6_05900 [Streptomyces sp. NPDC050842]|uniref:hypothetical protein n=1 Tax=Streptomyces sp. NPDC050842 TaxID=3365636 RepID=UPI0037A0C7F6